MSVPSSILIVKNLRLKNKMLKRLLVLWMLHRLFHASTSPIHPLMWSISLCTKFMAMMPRAYLHLLMYSFLVDSSTSSKGGLSDLSTMSQRSLAANIISILNFQRPIQCVLQHNGVQSEELKSRGGGNGHHGGQFVSSGP